MISSNLV